MEDENYMIEIPANVKVRMEVIDGIGIKELVQTAVAGMISIVIAIIVNAIFKNYFIALGIFLGVTGATFVAVMKDKNNSSIAGMIGNIFKFYKNQRFYKYSTHKELIQIDGGKRK